MRAFHTFEIEVEDKNFDIEVVMYGHRDTYGEDADGNRGVRVIEVDDVEYELPKELEGEERDLAERTLLKEIERHDWEWE